MAFRIVPPWHALEEAVAQTCSLKKMFLEISQNSQENACDGAACNFIKKETLAQAFSCKCYEISKNSFFYRTPLVAASVPVIQLLWRPKWVRYQLRLTVLR